MSKLVKEILDRTGVKRFAYDHEQGAFLVAGRTVPISEACDNPRLLQFRNEDEVAETEPMLTRARWNLLALPRMYDWIEEGFTEQDGVEAVRVMQDVFFSLWPDLPADSMRKYAAQDSLFGFSVSRGFAPGHLRLTVVGDCACMGVSAVGLTDEYDWHTKYASYDMHNIDIPDQEVSIQAGLGHLAYRVEQQA